MVIENRNFEEKIRDAFSDFEPRPPVHVWYGVIAGMKEPVAKVYSPLWLKVAAGLAILLVSSFSLLFFTSQPLGETPLLGYENNAASSPASAATISSAPNNLLSNATDASAEMFVPAAPALSSVARIDLPLSPAIVSPPALLASLPQSAPAPLLRSESFDNKQPLLAIEEKGGFLASVLRVPSSSRLAFGLHISPQYSFRYLSDPSASQSAGIPFERLEDPLFSQNFGISAYYQVSPWLRLQTGLSYNTIGQFVKDIYGFSHPLRIPLFEMERSNVFGHPQTIVTSQGNIRLSEPTLFFTDAKSYRVITNKQFFTDGEPKNLVMRDFGISQYFTFLEIPLMAHIKLLELSGADFHLKAGGSLNYLLDNEVFLGRKAMQKPIGETYGIRQYNVSAIGGLVANVPLGSHLSLTFEPTAQVYLMPMVRDQLMIGRALPLQFSIFTGITYGF